MNEATVRAEVLDPLIRRLGYRFGTDNDVLREHEFRYPRIQLGRKGKRDPELIGRPDYICLVRGVTTWVLEAKAEGQSLGEEANAQAFTYAAHREIRARYFCLADGKRFVVFDTYAPAGSDPILDVALTADLKSFLIIQALLGPDQLRAAKVLESSSVREIGPDFDILSGKAHFDEVNFLFEGPAHLRPMIEAEVNAQINLLKGTIYPIEGGSLRHNNGRLDLTVEIGGHTQADLEFQRLLGINEIHFETLGPGISTDIDRPSVFQTVQTAKLRPGDIMQSSRVAPQPVQFPVDFTISVDAALTRSNEKISGTFRYTSFAPLPLAGAKSSIQIELRGRIEAAISKPI